MSVEATGTLEDYVDLTQEDIHRSVIDLCHQLEREGWRVSRRSVRGLRYWCPKNGCNGCEAWIALIPLVDQRLEFLLRRLRCFTFKTEG